MASAAATPVRRALRAGSSLLPAVQAGFKAVKATDRGCFDPGLRRTFADSLDLDAALAAAHPNAHRWDYLLGHRPSGQIIGVDPHSAKQGEVQTVIEKRKAALEQLRLHLNDGTRVAAWLWVASGKVHKYVGTEKTQRLLDQHGIAFVGTTVLKKHLPAALPAGARKRTKARR